MRQVRCILCWAFCIYPVSYFLWVPFTLPVLLPHFSPSHLASSSIVPWGLLYLENSFLPPCGPFVSPLQGSCWLRYMALLCRRMFSCVSITSASATGNRQDYCINQGTHAQGTGPRHQILHLWSIRTVVMHRQNSLGSVISRFSSVDLTGVLLFFGETHLLTHDLNTTFPFLCN